MVGVIWLYPAVHVRILNLDINVPVLSIHSHPFSETLDIPHALREQISTISCQEPFHCCAA